VLSFLLFIALCASIAYWGLQLYDPPLRPVAASAQTEAAAPRMEAAAAVFGGRVTAAAASNFQLKGVIFSGTPRDSVAIIAIEGKPPQAFGVNAEVAPGVKVQEVHREYVVLSDGGAMKRIELPAATRGAQVSGMARRMSSPVPSTTPQQAAQSPARDQSQAAPQTAPAQAATVVTPVQESAPQNEGGEQAEGAEAPAQAPAPAASGEASNVEGEATSEPADPARTQGNPPRRP